MDNLFIQKVSDTNSVFDHHFMEGRTLFLQEFNCYPNVNYISLIDGEKAFRVIREHLANDIRNCYEKRWFKRKKKQFVFDTTIVVFESAVILEIYSDGLYLYHNGGNTSLMDRIVGLVLTCKRRQRKEPLEINLIIRTSDGLELKPMEIKSTKLDLALFYEDDFGEVDAIIQQRLKKNKDKGIVLLHGLPGTGKTTYLRYLVGKIKKRVLFLSPSVAGDLMNPDFIQLLVDNPNSVLVIEDAEHIIMDRRFSSGSSVSTLLNISDGLMADFLNVQLICTFNNSLTLIDNALLRKGRLIARYEFGKLSPIKAQGLSRHFGFDHLIDTPMTIAEIANPNEKAEEVNTRTAIIGFRRSGQ